MKSHPIEILLIGLLLFMPMMVFITYGDALFMRLPEQDKIIQAALAPARWTPTSAPSATRTAPPTLAATSTPTPTTTSTATATSTDTPLPPTNTATFEPTQPPREATKTPSIGEMLKTHIVFYLIISSTKRHDACGNFKLEPIISKRIRTGDKLQDVQIALNMLFSVSGKYYGPYYNALWDTDFTIESTEYNARKDYMTITFGGYFPFTQLSTCDKQGIRQQIWTTFFHYGFREKTFKYYDKFLIDRLGGG
jgi:hypothetical protein